MTINDMQTTTTSVTINRVYQTTPDRLFQAWTDPALVARWMAPGPHMTCKVPVYEVRKGGRFRIEMAGPGPDGSPRAFVYAGTFEEVTPGKRVRMNWDAMGADPATVVTATFNEVPGGTRLVFTHEGLPGKQWAEGAGAGWAAAMDALGKVL